MLNFFATFLHWMLEAGLSPLLALLLWALIIRVILFPIVLWTNKQTQQASSLRPQVQKIKEENQDDPDMMRQELLALYKEQGTGPFNSVLALFFVVLPLSVIGFLACNAGVVKPFWAFEPWGSQELATETTIFHWPIGLVLAGACALISIVSTWRSAKYKEGEEQKFQKLLAFFSGALFIMFAFILPFYLYWFILWVTIFTIVTNLIIHRLTKS